MKTSNHTTMNGKPPPAKDVAATYEEFKEFEGRKYTGMKVGRGHKWLYDQGEWQEKKVSPDKWEIHYSVTKRRVGKAPEGSGVPVGTGYHWYILAHQNVTKQNANDYTTSMTGMKFKLAHKRAGKDTWSESTQAQRRHLIRILQQVIQDLERDALVEAEKPVAVQKPRMVKQGELALNGKLTSRSTEKRKPRRVA